MSILWRRLQPVALLVEFSSVTVVAVIECWPFFMARRGHSGARVQS